MQRLKKTLLNFRLQLILTLFIVLISLLMLINDYLTALIFNQSYYLNESLLFKITIVLLLLPALFYTSLGEIKHSREINVVKVLLLLVPTAIVHVFVASYLIQLIGQNLLNLPFTFSFLIKNKFTQDFVFIITTYGLMYLIARYYYLNISKANNNKNKTLSIKSGTRRDIIDIVDIDWISAETPYIAIWIDEKKHLYNSTLTDILNKIEHTDFIRIHRSTIVNISKISSITSRLNGDYDIQLYNDTKLRLSRTYRTPEIDSQLRI